MFTAEDEPKLKVGGFVAPAGLVATAAVKATLPVNPPLGVTVMVEVLPLPAPRETAIEPLLLSAKAAGSVTRTEFVPDPALYVDELAESGV